jgi:hypothetical protein
MPTFSLECFHNDYLPQGGEDVNAIVTTTATGAGVSGGAAEASPGAEVIIIDVSGSMRGEKLRQACRATEAAIGCIRDGVRFGIVAGYMWAESVYPPARRSWRRATPRLVPATPDTRAEATAAVRGLTARGGTAIGRWIDMTAKLLATEQGVRHAILLTDGQDVHETPKALGAALERAAGIFQCDCRGVGTDWDVAELRRVATALLGTVDIVADPKHLTADFEEMMRQAMRKAVADVRLRIWAPQGSQILFVKQVAPELQDLTTARSSVNELTGDYPTGAWGNESRDYHLSVRVRPGEVGEEMLAARVNVVVDGEAAGQALVRAIWTDDTALSTRINRQVAHYTGQQELADAIQEGLEARKNGDEDTAVVKLGRAVQLAAQSDNAEMAALLEKVVDVDDAATGKVRLRSRVDAADEMTLDTRSTKTMRVKK